MNSTQNVHSFVFALLTTGTIFMVTYVLTRRKPGIGKKRRGIVQVDVIKEGLAGENEYNVKVGQVLKQEKSAGDKSSKRRTNKSKERQLGQERGYAKHLLTNKNRNGPEVLSMPRANEPEKKETMIDTNTDAILLNLETRHFNTPTQINAFGQNDGNCANKQVGSQANKPRWNGSSKVVNGLDGPIKPLPGSKKNFEHVKSKIDNRITVPLTVAIRQPTLKTQVMDFKADYSHIKSRVDHRINTSNDHNTASDRQKPDSRG